MPCTVQAVAAREGLEQQLQEMQASLAGSAASSPHQAAAGINAESPFAKHSGVVQEMQGQVARLKTENAMLRAEVAEQHAEVAELRSAAAHKGISLGKSPRLGVHHSLPPSHLISEHHSEACAVNSMFLRSSAVCC